MDFAEDHYKECGAFHTIHCEKCGVLLCTSCGKELRWKDEMKVGCMEYDKTFEVEEESIVYRKLVVSFKCPICGGEAYRKETDVFLCSCGLVWCVE